MFVEFFCAKLDGTTSSEGFLVRRSVSGLSRAYLKTGLNVLCSFYHCKADN